VFGCRLMDGVFSKGQPSLSWCLQVSSKVSMVSHFESGNHKVLGSLRFMIPLSSRRVFVSFYSNFFLSLSVIIGSL